MFTHIETLIARAATHLRVTQSTVNKRLAALECEVGRPLTEAHGRGVRLTPAGHRLLTRVEPLVASLRQALQEEELQTGGRLEIGVSESILASWGPRVRSGEYTLALAAGVSEETPDLQAEILLEETMALVPSGLKPLTLTPGATLSVLTIEPGSATWGLL